jgi:hypothetical protein
VEHSTLGTREATICGQNPPEFKNQEYDPTLKLKKYKETKDNDKRRKKA